MLVKSIAVPDVVATAVPLVIVGITTVPLLLIVATVVPLVCISTAPLVSETNFKPLLVSALILHVIRSPIFVHLGRLRLHH